MKTWAARWNRFWFGEASGQLPLGVLRVVLVGRYALYAFHHDLEHMARSRDVPLELLSQNLGLKLMPLPYPLPAFMDLPFAVLAHAALVGALLGLCTRPALVVLATLATYLAAGFAATQVFNHELIVLLGGLWILAVSPGSDSFSLDAWWRRRRGGAGSSPSAAGERCWLGLRLLCCSLALVYLAAGVSKLRYSEGRWLNGETLAFYLSRTDAEQLYYGSETLAGPAWKGGVALIDHSYGGAAAPWARRLAAHSDLVAWIAAATVAFELAAPLLLFPDPLRSLYILGALAMHSAIGAAMGLSFDSYRILLLCLLPWPRWLNRAETRGSA